MLYAKGSRKEFLRSGIHGDETNYEEFFFDTEDRLLNGCVKLHPTGRLPYSM